VGNGKWKVNTITEMKEQREIFSLFLLNTISIFYQPLFYLLPLVALDDDLTIFGRTTGAAMRF
jgi:hypothetical protein